MRWPYVETEDSYSFSLLYYGEPKPRDVDGKADVDSRRLIMAEIVLDAAVLGQDRADIVDATLLFASYEVTREFRISGTVTLIERAARLNNTSLTDDFIDYLVERSTATLTGVALVGALRAVAWAISRRRPHPKRRQISDLTRGYARGRDMVAIHASLFADDAHAHLFAAERLRPPADEPKRSEIIELRQALAVRGGQLLAAAFAAAQQEPWNPFLERRLLAEKDEHGATPAEVGLGASSWNAVEDMAKELVDRWQVVDSEWRATVEENGDDIGAFFWLRKPELALRGAEYLSRSAEALVRLEPTLTRYI
ncbi:hypothetical protein [Polymorphospora rubra]|uniref:hypothetical protein n=1 Tax=Polymorphospora rubra TaxID=338584 RepID=UPI0033CA542F